LREVSYGVATFAPLIDSSAHRLVGLHFLDVTDPFVPLPVLSAVVDLATGAETPHGDEHASLEG